MKVAKRTVKNTFFNFLSIFIGNLSGLFLIIILARILKPENFGIYSLAIVVANLSVGLATVGIDNAVVRYVSFYHRRDDNLLRSHFRYFLKVKTAISSLASAMLILFSGLLSNLFGDEKLRIPFIFASVIVLFMSINGSFNSFSKGLQRFDLVFFRQIIYEFTRWVLTIPLAIAFLALGAIAGVALSYLISTLTILYLLVKNYRSLIFGETFAISGKAKKYMGFMSIASLSGITFTYVDSIMIGYLLDATHVGFYRAAYTPVFAIAGFASSLAGVLLPTFTQLSENQIEAGLSKLNRYVSMVIFPLTIVIVSFSPQIILVLYGKEYLISANAMKVLALGMIAGGYGYLTSILNAKERADLVASIVVAGMMANIILNYILIPEFGIAGAAIATTLSRFMVIASVVIVLIKILKINPKIGDILKPLIASVPVAIYLMLISTPRSLIIGIMEITTSFIIYLIILMVLKGLTKGDIEYIIKLLGIR